MKIFHPFFRSKYKEKKATRQIAHGGISISRGSRSRDYFERENREKGNRISRTRVLRRGFFRGKGVGESSISRAVGSQPLSAYELTATGSMTAYLESTLCPFTKREKVQVQIRPPIRRMYLSVIYSATESRENRDLWQIHARFCGLAKRVSRYRSRDFYQSNLKPNEKNQ